MHRKKHLDWNPGVFSLTPALLLKAFLLETSSNPSRLRGSGREQGHNAPCLADAPGQPKGRREAALHDDIARGLGTARLSQRHPCEVLDWPSGPSPAHSGLLSSLYGWVKEGRFPWDIHCLSLSLSPGALRLRPSSEVLGPEWKAPEAKQAAGVQHVQLVRDAHTHPAPLQARHSLGVSWAVYLGQALQLTLLHHRTPRQGGDFILQRGGGRVPERGSASQARQCVWQSKLRFCDSVAQEQRLPSLGLGPHTRTMPLLSSF